MISWSISISCTIQEYLHEVRPKRVQNKAIITEVSVIDTDDPKHHTKDNNPSKEQAWKSSSIMENLFNEQNEYTMAFSNSIQKHQFYGAYVDQEAAHNTHCS